MKPMRHPVMAYAFDTPLTMIVRSRTASNSEIDANLPVKLICS